MGGHKNTSKSNMNNASNFSQNIPAFQQNALAQLYAQAANIFGQTNGKMMGQTGNISDYINSINKSALPSYQNNLNGGVYDGIDSKQLMDSLNSSMGKPTNTQKIYANMMGGEGNNYADAMKASFTGDANRATDNMLSNLDARAAASGMSGGSRHGVATSQGMYDINSNLQKNLADVGYNTFDKDLQNKLSIAGQADSSTLARQQMMQNMLGQKQNTITNGLSMGGDMQNLGMGSFAPYMMPWQGMSNYANVIGSPTILSNGSSSGSGSANSKGKGGGMFGS